LEVLPAKSLLSPNYVRSPQRSVEFQIFIWSEVYEEIWRHINDDKTLETGGVLIGHPFRDINSPGRVFIIISGNIRQDSANRSIGHYTVSPDEIAASRSELEEYFEGLVVVGWYHSHPGHGVFLSAQDQQIAQSIYNQEWQVSLVIDPIKRKAAYFRGQEGIGPLGWIEMREKPECIHAIRYYNQAMYAYRDRDKTQIARFLEYMREHKDGQLSHWWDLGFYQNIDLNQGKILNAESLGDNNAKMRIKLFDSDVADTDPSIMVRSPQISYGQVIQDRWIEPVRVPSSKKNRKFSL